MATWRPGTLVLCGATKAEPPFQIRAEVDTPPGVYVREARTRRGRRAERANAAWAAPRRRFISFSTRYMQWYLQSSTN